METVSQDFAARLERLERDVEELADAMARRSLSPVPQSDPLSRISLSGWLRVSGPTFAVMIFGFTLLWNAQQSANAQLLEVSRTMGRLEGAIAGLDARVTALDERLISLDQRLISLGERLISLDERLISLDQRLISLDERLMSLDERMSSLDGRLTSLEEAILTLGDSVRSLGGRSATP